MLIGSRIHILIIRGGAIGDFILTLPVLSILRQKFPHARLEILGYPTIAHIALPQLADAVQPIESPALASFFIPNGELNPTWISYFGKFDLIISYAYDPEQILAQNIQRCSKAQFIAASHRPNEKESLHATEVFIRPLKQLGLLSPDEPPQRECCRLVVGRGVGKISPKLTIAIHPGSGSEKKNWPEEKWGSFLQHLAATRNCHLLLIGGEAEGEKLHRLAAKLPSEKIELAQNLPLPKLAQKLSYANFFIGHDSGITHLAAALDLPGIVLWGFSNFTIWRPCSEKMTFVQHPEGLTQLPLSTVISAFENHPTAQSFSAS